MIEFFVGRVRSEKVGNGAGAGASKMGRGICGFSIPPPVRRTGDGWDRMIPRLPPNICVWISFRFGCRVDADALRTPSSTKRIFRRTCGVTEHLYGPHFVRHAREEHTVGRAICLPLFIPSIPTDLLFASVIALPTQTDFPFSLPSRAKLSKQSESRKEERVSSSSGRGSFTLSAPLFALFACSQSLQLSVTRQAPSEFEHVFNPLKHP